MTCIVGYVEKEKVYIGGDSAGADVSTYEACVRADEKVFKKNGMVFGFTTSFRMGQIIRYCFNPPEQSSKKTDYEYLCSDFIDALVKCFKDKGFATIKNSVVSGGVFLMGYRGNLYLLGNDFQVAQMAKDYHACGCGISYALGALHCMENMVFPPEGRITKALEAASEFSAYVRPPFNILSI